MREMRFPKHLDAISGASSERSAGPLTDTVDDDDGCVFERAAKKCRGRMGLMMLAKIDLAVEAGDLIVDDLGDFKLLVDPNRNAASKRLKAFVRKLEVGLQEPAESRDRLVIVSHRSQICCADSTGF